MICTELDFEFPAPWTALCGSGWSYNRNAQACYKFISTRVTWEDAEARCQAEGSHLLSVHGQAEMDYINGQISDVFQRLLRNNAIKLYCMIQRSGIFSPS